MLMEIHRIYSIIFPANANQLKKTWQFEISAFKFCVKREKLGLFTVFLKERSLINILMVLGRIIDRVNADCRCKNDNSAYLGFLINSFYPFLYLVSGLSLSNNLKYFNVTL